jgi:transcriptional regulator GlxA family with amidase domain
MPAGEDGNGAARAVSRHGVNFGQPLHYAVMHIVGFYVCPGHQVLDLAGPLGAFESVTVVLGRPAYELCVLSRAGGMVQGSGGLAIATQPARGAVLDTLLSIGGELAPMLDAGEAAAVRALAQDTPRVASVCTGAFLLAEAGLLRGRRATTHWRAARRLQQRHPEVKVESDRIFVRDGALWSSAGVTAGIDLALALIEADHGIDVARQVARELVVYHRRAGGQSQFAPISHMEPQSDRIRLALGFARDHLHQDLRLERLAEAAHLSPRQFGRLFHQETGETPAKAVERMRVEAARARLQDGTESIERIARAVGFGDPERMRRAFLKWHGTPPQALRRKERAPRA